MASTNCIDVKVFIEGVEIPVGSVSITHATNTMSFAQIDMAPVSSVPDIKARSIVCIGVRDPDSYGGNDYILLFAGETTDPSISWTPGGYSLSISAYSFDNHWYAVPIYMVTEGNSKLFSRTPGESALIAKGGGSALTAEQRAAVLGSNLQYSWFEGEQVERISSLNSLQGGDQQRETKGIPTIFTEIYTANSFWRFTGRRTGMSDPSKYYYYSEDLFQGELGNFIKTFTYYYLASQIGYNTKFITFWEGYRQSRFASYCLNHQMLRPHVLVFTGFEYVYPPACNIVFPHQFRQMASVGRNLSAPTRTLGMIPPTDINQSGDILRHIGICRAMPPALQRMVQNGEFDRLKEIQPSIIPEEEWRGIVGNIVMPNAPLIQAMLNKDMSFDIITKYFDYMLSDMHAKLYNQSQSSVIPCTFIPAIQVGLPAVFIKPPHNLLAAQQKEGIEATVLYGFVETVTHSISRGGAQTIVTLKDSKLISSKNVMPTPVPIWISSNMGLANFQEVYNTCLGCSSIDNVGRAVADNLSLSISKLGNAFSLGASSLASKVASSGFGTVANFVSMAGSAVKGLTAADTMANIHGPICESAQALLLKYINFKTDTERVKFATNVTKRSFTSLFTAVQSFQYEVQRVAAVKNYREQIKAENKVFVENSYAADILEGRLDMTKGAINALGEKTVISSAPYSAAKDLSGSLFTHGAYASAAGVKLPGAAAATPQAPPAAYNDANYSSVAFRQIDGKKILDQSVWKSDTTSINPDKYKYKDGDSRIRKLRINTTGYFPPPLPEDQGFGGYFSERDRRTEGGGNAAKGIGITQKLRTIEDYVPGSYVTAATDGSVIPHGSLFYISGFNDDNGKPILFYALDTGKDIVGNKVDIATLGHIKSSQVSGKNWEATIIGYRRPSER